MCFSATASFGAGVLLTGIGIASIKQVNEPKQYLFASIPLVFAVQQLSEGMVWLSHTCDDWYAYRQLSIYTFLFFAQVLWPTWVPLSMMQMEKDKTRKRILSMLAAAGSALSIYLLYCLTAFDVSAESRRHHMFYDVDFPAMVNTFGAAIYFIVVVFPPLISSIKSMKWFGAAILFSYLISTIFFVETKISSWCFFAAVTSFCIYLILRSFKISSQTIESKI